MTLTNLSTTALLDGITALLGSERSTLARLLVHLVEVEDRRAHLEVACSSLFDFCTRRLALSEGEAFRRINAARLVRRFPVVLGMIESGSIHLSALVLLRDHLTDDNHAALLGDAAGKSKTHLKELLAERFPRPDILPSIRKLPERVLATPNDIATAPQLHLDPRGAEVGKSRAVVEPLSPARYRVELTASAELKEKLDRAARLMSHRHLEKDLAVVVERALDHLLVALEKERFAKTLRPRPPRAAKPGHITRAVRREVVDRDGEQCTFVSESDERCPSRTHLEFDHRRPRALGGTGDATNVRLLCRGHNHFAAEQIFGQKHIAGRIDLRRRKSGTTAGAGAMAGGALRARDDAAPPNSDPSAVFELAARALTTMGFRVTEAEKAIGWVRDQRGLMSFANQDIARPPAVEEVLRAALAVLDRARTLQTP